MKELENGRERFVPRFLEVGGRLRVRNALNPILWLCVIIATPSIGVFAWTKEPSIIISIVLCATVGTAIVGFLYLLVFDRDRLQSEEYLIKRQTLELIEEKGSKKAIDAITVTAISQKDFLSLPDNGDEQ